MPYIKRHAGGAITGLYTWPQPGRAEEYLADDSAEVLAFLAPTEGDLKARASALRDEKLSVGFDYDFGDDRGVHRFGTAEAPARLGRGQSHCRRCDPGRPADA